eukprot:GILI01001326.1.p1 GENE.GILI01001326.1~~GILI01001326.1.p1  ORF type:complete len:314 (+),score=90.26 GILI01001326.1:64-942(+)
MLTSRLSTLRLGSAFNASSLRRSNIILPTSSRLFSSTPVSSPAQSSVNVQDMVDFSVTPVPMRKGTQDKKWDTKDLESISVEVGKHLNPADWRDKAAWKLVRFLRVVSDLFFRDRYVHRAVTLETVAAIPGMVTGVHRHLSSLRGLKHDGGWIHHMLHEAENERIHLMVWMKICKPNIIERSLVLAVQGIFFNAYFLLYLVDPKLCHRFVGYLEEEAVISYTHLLHDIDAGKIKNTPAPAIAIHYWNLKEGATLRDVTLAVRADEALHRDINHHLVDRLKAGADDLRVPFSG